MANDAADTGTSNQTTKVLNWKEPIPEEVQHRLAEFEATAGVEDCFFDGPDKEGGMVFHLPKGIMPKVLRVVRIKLHAAGYKYTKWQLSGIRRTFQGWGKV